MKASEIRKSNPKGKMTKVSGTNYIKFDNGVVFESQSPREMNILWRKLKRMGFEQHYNFSSNEFEGLCQANPDEVFNYSIISR